MIDHYYPNTGWLRLHRDAFDILDQSKRDNTVAKLKQAIDRLLESTREGVA